MQGYPEWVSRTEAISPPFDTGPADGGAEELPRGDFAKLAGAVGTEVGLRFPVTGLLFNLLDEAALRLEVEARARREQQRSLEQSLEQCGLGDYASALQMGQEVVKLFGGPLPVFGGVYDVLYRAGRGEFSDPDDPQITALRDGWGERSLTEAIGPAQDFVQNRVDIQVSSGDGGSEEQMRRFEQEIRQFFVDAANSHPLHALSLNPYCTAQLGISREQVAGVFLYDTTMRLHLMLVNLSDGQENLDLSLIKSHVARAGFADYLNYFFYCLFQTCREFQAYPEELAVEGLIGGFSSNDVDQEPQECGFISEFNAQIGEMCTGFQIANIAPKNSSLKEVTKAWYTFLHRVGRRVWQTPEEERKDDFLVQGMQMLLRGGIHLTGENGQIYHLPGLVERTAEYLCKPTLVAKAGSNYLLPNDEADPAIGGVGDMAAYKRLLRKVGNNRFTNLPPDASLTQIRQGLGLPDADPVYGALSGPGRTREELLRKLFENAGTLIALTGLGGMLYLLKRVKRTGK